MHLANKLPLCSLIFFLTSINFAFAENKSEPLEDTKVKTSFFSNTAWGGGAHIKYSYNNKLSSFKGIHLSSVWITSTLLHEVKLSFSESHVEVASPVKPSNAQRLWDLEYSWEYLSNRSKVRGFYWMPNIGIRYKEKLKVTCTKINEYCFNTYSDNWDIQSKNGDIKPLLGVKSGVRIPLKKLLGKLEVQFTSDSEGEFIGLSASLYYGSLKK